MKIEVPQSEFVTLQPKKSNLDFQCQCKELSITTNESLCSDYASTRGNDQKVISISYFNQEVEKLRKIVEDTYAFYPGYFLRIYHNLTEKQVGYNSRTWRNRKNQNFHNFSQNSFNFKSSGIVSKSRIL